MFKEYAHVLQLANNLLENCSFMFGSWINCKPDLDATISDCLAIVAMA